MALTARRGQRSSPLTRLSDLLHDPDRTALHRALRVALVTPPLFAFGLHGLENAQFALLAAFGSISAMAMADFTGPRRSRLLAYLVLALLGGVLIVVGTALSNTLWAAVLAMLAVGVALQFAAALGGQFALGNNAAILTFVVCVMVPAGNDAIADRLEGWLLACACAAVASTLLWPRHERRDLYQRLVAACRALATLTRSAAANAPRGSDIDDARAAIDRVRQTQGALGFRPIGPHAHQQALLGLLDDLAQAWRCAGAARAGPPMPADDRRLADAVATTLDAVADVLLGCVEGHPGDGPDIAALVAVRHAHRERLEAATIATSAANASATSVIDAVRAVFPVRVLSFVTLSMAADAIVLTGRTARIVGDNFGTVEPLEAESPLRYVVRVLGPHLSPQAVWLRNSLRAGVALALSVLIAKISGIEHAFWVVLATLTVLRSNVATTGATVVSAVIGTFAGFLLATVTTLAIGTQPVLLWASLPLAVFLAAYAPAAISLGAGQAMFALLVVQLFSLMAPAGWETGAIRLEAVTLGALTALATSLILWPKGAAAALRAEVALHVRAACRLTQAAFDVLQGAGNDAQVESARHTCQDARQRVEEALAAYAGERGAKRVPLPVWALLARIPVSMRVADDAITVLRRAGFGIGGCPAAAQQVAQTARSVCASFGALADRLDDPALAPDRALNALIVDLDMVDGTGNRRAEIAAATAACLDAHRGDAVAVREIMGLSWAAGWLGYLAHLRLLTEAPLDEVLARADTPWWR